ncbi:hypothetical protein BD626DRAFT_632247 [Schizophyllum amplum]|uniref:Uncharacterized protein n=1 Tax=Schizophyllum amplum TaxID=97359 RepID=A0A550C7M6_9AGAR|nr:hypothetical protein BD626DRAFT_632247 [Auriculariopsis ampla]
MPAKDRRVALPNTRSLAAIAAPKFATVPAARDDPASSPCISAGPFRALTRENTFAGSEKNPIGDGEKENDSTTDAARASRDKGKARQVNEFDDINSLPVPSDCTLAQALPYTQGAQAHKTASPPSRDPETSPSSIDTNEEHIRADVSAGESPESHNQQAAAEALAVFEVSLNTEPSKPEQVTCDNLQAQPERLVENGVQDTIDRAQDLSTTSGGVEQGNGNDDVSAPSTSNATHIGRIHCKRRHNFDSSEVSTNDQLGQVPNDPHRRKRQRQEQPAGGPPVLDGACHGNSDPSRASSSEPAPSDYYDYAEHGFWVPPFADQPRLRLHAVLPTDSLELSDNHDALSDLVALSEDASLLPRDYAQHGMWVPDLTQPQLRLLSPPFSPVERQDQGLPAPSHAPLVVGGPLMANISAAMAFGLPPIAAGLISSGGRCPWTHRDADEPCQQVFDLSQPDLAQQFRAHIEDLGGKL